MTSCYWAPKCHYTIRISSPCWRNSLRACDWTVGGTVWAAHFLLYLVSMALSRQCSALNAFFCNTEMQELTGLTTLFLLYQSGWDAKAENTCERKSVQWIVDQLQNTVTRDLRRSNIPFPGRLHHLGGCTGKGRGKQAGFRYLRSLGWISVIPLDPWEQTAGLLLDFPAALRQGRRGGGREQHCSWGSHRFWVPTGWPQLQRFYAFSDWAADRNSHGVNGR